MPGQQISRNISVHIGSFESTRRAKCKACRRLLGARAGSGITQLWCATVGAQVCGGRMELCLLAHCVGLDIVRCESPRHCRSASASWERRRPGVS